jgi:hypothetical protein
MTAGRSLELFFIDGQPDGLLSAESFNWTGHVLQIPRTRLKDAISRPEASFTGVYLLLGENEEGPIAYIGESEDLAARLKSHAVEKEWWDRAILITTSANNLHKAHVKYLESRLVQLAREAKETPLENGNTPPRSSLSEAAATNMEVFIENLMVVLPAIRVDLFVNRSRPITRHAEDHVRAKGTEFELSYPNFGISARALLSEGEFIVSSGSTARDSWVGKASWDSGYRKLRDKLVESKIIRIADGIGEFIENYAFSSPSAAAAVILGRSANGRQEWRVQGSLERYADWEDAQLERVKISE